MHHSPRFTRKAQCLHIAPLFIVSFLENSNCLRNPRLQSLPPQFTGCCSQLRFHLLVLRRPLKKKKGPDTKNLGKLGSSFVCTHSVEDYNLPLSAVWYLEKLPYFFFLQFHWNYLFCCVILLSFEGISLKLICHSQKSKSHLYIS